MASSHFYYKQKNLDDHYSYTPPGDISVKHFIRRERYWKLPGSVSPLKNKTLILADWTIASWSEKKKRAVIKEISELMHKGFSIYAWQAGQVELLTRENLVSFLEDPFAIERFTSAFPNEIESVAIYSVPELEKDKILVLDDYQIKGLLNPNVFHAPRTIDSYELMHSRQDEKELQKVLQRTNPPIAEITDSFITEESFNLLEKWQKLLPEAKVVGKFESVLLTGKMIQELFEKQEIEISKRKFNLRHLSLLEEITFDNVANQDLERLLPLLSHIKKIHFKNSSSKLNFELSRKINFPKLEELRVTETEMSAETLENLLAISPNIRHIYLDDSSNIKGRLTVKSPLDNLEQITLHHTTLSAESFHSIILNSKPKKIILQDGGIVKGFVNDDIDLSSLETLEIKECSGRLDDFNELFSKCSNIKNLIVTALEIKDINKKIALDGLKTLKIDLGSFKEFISAFGKSQLEKLILVDASTTKNPLIVPNIALDKLKHLSIRNTPLAIDVLQKFLEKAVNVTYLDLQSCTNLAQINIPLKLYLVEKLNLSKSDITTESLLHMLKGMPVLKKLDLSGCQSIKMTPELESLLEGMQVYLPNHIKTAKKQKKASIPEDKNKKTTNHADNEKYVKAFGRENKKEANGSSYQEKTHSNSDEKRNENNEKRTSSDSDDGRKSSRSTGKKGAASSRSKNTDGGDESTLSDIRNTSDKEEISSDSEDDAKEKTYSPDSNNVDGKEKTSTSDSIEADGKEKTNSSDSQDANGKEKTNSSHSKDANGKGKTSSSDSNNADGKEKTSSSHSKDANGKGKTSSSDSKDANGKEEDSSHSKDTDGKGEKTSSDSKETETDDEQNEAWNSSQTIDSDTKANPTTYHLKRVFSPVTPGVKMPHVSEYRQTVFNKVEISNEYRSMDKAFLLKSEGDLQLEECDAVRCGEDVMSIASTLTSSDTHNCYYGKQRLKLSKQWRPLTSLSSMEHLTHYHLSPHSDKVEIRYSKRDNMYYLRSTDNPINVEIDFLLEVPTIVNSIPQSIKVLSEFFNSFSSGTIDIDSSKATGRAYVDAIVKQKIGACRHRTIGFVDVMEKTFPEIDVRVIGNGCHMFPEVNIDNQWIGCDLGGYPATLKIDETNTLGKGKSYSTESYAVFNEVKQVPHVSNDDLALEKYFETWHKAQERTDSVRSYCQKLLQPQEDKKFLIELMSDGAQQALMMGVLEHCKKISRPVFYVDSPDDLICSAHFIENKQGKGILKKGPGGLLYNFLNGFYDKSNPPVLVINYSKFSADDLVRFNGMLDDHRHADGTPLPPETMILGFMNVGNPNSYDGEDFYSRFDKVEECLFGKKDLMTAYPPFSLEPYTAKMTSAVNINLYHASDWQENLLGRWVIRKDNLYFEPGKLQTALQKGSVINIQNGLWEDESFQRFWQHACLNGYYDYAGERFKLPDNLKIVREEGYDWKLLQTKLSLQYGLIPTAEVLNPSLVSQFFSQYQVDNNSKTIDQVPGILENYKGKKLSVNLTRTIGEDAWARILSECEKLNIDLQCYVMPGVEVPEPLRLPKKQPNIVADWDKKIETPLLFIQSTDPDTTIFQLTEKEKDWMVIDVSELDASDLLTRINGKFDENKLSFEFYQVERFLLTALKENKKIILTGTFSENLIDTLIPFLLSRINDGQAPSKLVLVHDQPPFFSFQQTRHQVVISEKYKAMNTGLSDDYLLNFEQLAEEGISVLNARVNYHRAFKSKDTDKAWQGFLELPPYTELPNFDLKNSKEKTRAFIKGRLDAIQTTLRYSPYVYLTGLTGVGKSTFIEKYIKDLPHTTLYLGEAQFKDWAADQSANDKILFLDEANITTRQWSEIEGLLRNPPSIFIDGQYYPLTPEHKVIFAGNPLNYGNERQLAPLFKRHGNALVFEPMPAEFIYEEIIKPVFPEEISDEKSMQMGETFLSVYRFLVNISHKEVLISARELQMMALQTLTFHRNFPGEDIQNVAAHYAHQIGRALVPEDKLAGFDLKFKPRTSAKRSDGNFIKKDTASYQAPESRIPVIEQLTDLLYLRDFKRHQAKTNSQKYGGLGGLILEGEPGVGKSELVTAILLKNGFSEISINKKSQRDKIFYRLPISMGLDEKKAILLKAFDEGAVVIIDEINSSPMLERWLNDLLMGIHPLEKRRPKKPGFFIFGTQNPVTMAGRRRFGNALARRFLTTVLPSYTQEDMEGILNYMGLEPAMSTRMVNAFIKKYDEAQAKHLTPAPTFRDLIRLARNHLKAKQREVGVLFSLANSNLLLKKIVLKQTYKIKPATLKEMGKLPDIAEKFFEKHGDLFIKLIQKNLSKEQLNTLFDFLEIASKQQLSDAQTTTYFKRIEPLLSENVESFTALNDFFAKNPANISQFFDKTKQVRMKLLVQMVKAFSDYPELISHLLMGDGKLLIAMEDKYEVYAKFMRKYFISYGALGVLPPERLLLLLEVAAWLEQKSPSSWQENLLTIPYFKLATYLEIFKSSSAEPTAALNIFHSKARNKLNWDTETKEDILKYNQYILNGEITNAFNFSNNNIEYSAKRAKLLYHLEQKTFVTDVSQDKLWTEEKNASALQYIYRQYSNIFRGTSIKQNRVELLVVANELQKMPDNRRAKVSDDLKKDLSATLSRYQHSFWVRASRQERAEKLNDKINETGIQYKALLSEIFKAREEIFKNDTYDERHMHRFGRSRYYDTLNQLEEHLIATWVSDREAISTFKDYLQHSETLLHSSMTLYVQAFNREAKKNTLPDFNKSDAMQYSDLVLANITANEKESSGAVRALGREVLFRLSAMKKYQEIIKKTGVDIELEVSQGAGVGNEFN